MVLTEQIYEDQVFQDIAWPGHDLTDLEFSGCTFKGGNFSDYMFTRASFTDCTFDGCNLSNVVMEGCRFQNVIFCNCKVLGIVFAKISPFLLSWEFRQCRLQLCNFSGLRMSKTKFHDSSVRETDFINVDLKEACFNASDLQGSKFHNANKLDSFDNRLQVLICQKDTLNGLHLVFGDGFTYGSFIKALNICYKDSFASFMVYENQLWYLFKNKDAQLKERIKTRRKERSLSEHINNENKEIALNKSSLIEKYKGLIKIWPALIVFGFLGFLSFRSIRNKYSGPNHTNCKRI